MAAVAGRNLLLQVESSAGSGTYNTVANLTTLSFSQDNGTTDITNKSSNGWQELLQGAGTKIGAISASGILEGGTEQDILLTNSQTNIIYNYRVLYKDTNDTITGAFQITNLTINGATDDAQTFDVTLSSSGAITFA